MALIEPALFFGEYSVSLFFSAPIRILAVGSHLGSGMLVAAFVANKSQDLFHNFKSESQPAPRQVICS